MLNVNIYFISLDIEGLIVKTDKSILVHSIRGRELYHHVPHTLCSLTLSHLSLSLDAGSSL